MPIKDTIWIHDPPTSSYPACIAVKCAALQSPEAAENYLRRLREAVMLEAKNISKEEVLLEVANSLARDKPHLFDAEAFEEKLHREEGREAFREDLQQVRYNSISRFPTLTLQKPQQPGVMIVGYRPYDVLLQALEQIAPDLQPTQLAVDAEVYADYWGHTNEREVREALTYVNT
jgi:predicted DsbA family dithiol-disulfide isomerase